MTVTPVPDPPTTTTDLALLRALLGWGGPDAARAWDRLGDGWRARLEDAGLEVENDPEDARSALQAEHAAEARPDPAHVHPTWWIRALQGESLAVVLAVAAHADPAIAEVIRRDLFLDPDDWQPDRPPHPGALEATLALWTERLVGGPAARPDDPPIVAALTRPGPHELYRLVHLTGLAKHAYAPKEPRTGDPHPPSPRDLVRIERLRRLWGRRDPTLIRIAVWDLDETADVVDRALSPLGLITIGRLLAVVEPHRTRWVLQHLPYTVARWLRPRITLKNSFVRRRILLAWETQVFNTAMEFLGDERRPEGDDLPEDTSPAGDDLRDERRPPGDEGDLA